MAYEPIVTLGNVIQILGTILAFVGIYVRVIERLTKLESKMESFREDLDTKIIRVIYEESKGYPKIRNIRKRDENN